MPRLLLLEVAVLAVMQLSERESVDRLAAAFGIVVVAAWLWSRLATRRLTIERRPRSQRAAVGDLFDETIVLRNRSWIPKPWLEVLDYSTLPGHVASRVVRAPGNGEAVWQARTRCVRRGRFLLGPARVSAADPFGLFPRHMLAPSSVHVTIFPVALDLPGFLEPIGLLTGGARAGWSHISSPSVVGVRDYVPGDPTSRISWTATARYDRLMVKELEQDPIADAWVVLDLDAATHVAAGRQVAARNGSAVPFEAYLDSTTEYAVALAASLARTMIGRGRSVGLIATGAAPIIFPPERGDAAFLRMQEELAVVQADGHAPLAEALRAHDVRFTRQAALVIVTASADPAWAAAAGRLVANGIGVHAVVVQAETFGAAGSSLHAIGEAIAAGVQVTPVAAGDALAGIFLADEPGWRGRRD
jgi:uncharacterized protein (DUF58 family)